MSQRPHPFDRNSLVDCLMDGTTETISSEILARLPLASVQGAPRASESVSVSGAHPVQTDPARLAHAALHGKPNRPSRADRSRFPDSHSAGGSGSRARCRSERVYLMAPATWKAVSAAAGTRSTDWSPWVSAPSAWANKRVVPAPVPTILSRRRSRIEFFVSVTSWIDGLRAKTLGVFSQMARAKWAYGARAWAVRWLTWGQADQRRAMAAVSLCAVFGAMAVLQGARLAHSRPEPGKPPPARTQPGRQESITSAAASVVVPTPRPRAVEAATVSPPPNRSPSVSLQASAPSALLTDVSTMDLVMPVAEPDLDIASRDSLWAQVGKSSGLDPLLLYSVALVESRALLPDGKVGPTPWLFRVNDHLVLGDRQHVQMQMAVASQFGSMVQDVGIMQVYYPMHRDAVPDPLTLLDPKTNITVAAKILRDGMRETRDPVLGVGYYHSHTPELARDYGTAVLAVYQRLKSLYRSGKAAQITARAPAVRA